MVNGVPFNDAYRYVHWLLTVPLPLIEILLVMKLGEAVYQSKIQTVQVMTVTSWRTYPVVYLFPMLGINAEHQVGSEPIVSAAVVPRTSSNWPSNSLVCCVTDSSV